MKKGKRVKPKFPIEYRVLIMREMNEREKRMVTRVALRTTIEFRNFHYEIIVEPILDGRTLHLKIHGLRAPQVTIPGTGPAKYSTTFGDLDGDGDLDLVVAAADEQYAKEAGLQVVLREGYSASAPDLSALVTKLKRANADVISHAGYNPDITLFLRQARESGLRFKMLFGVGAGYSQLDKLRATFGKDIDNFCNIDPVPAQLLDPKKLAPGVGDLTKIMVERYKGKTGATDVPPHCSMGFNQTWVLLNNVLPVAKEKYGGFDPDAIRKAAPRFGTGGGNITPLR